MALTYGKVIGKFVTVRGDGADVDRLPDVIGATNTTITFTPEITSFSASDLQALATADPTSCTVDTDGVMLDAQGQQGVWLLTGTYTVKGHSLLSKIVVTDAHTDVAPLDLWTAVNFTPPPGTTVQTLVVPAGAAEGQVLGWVSGALGWVDPAAGGGGGAVDSVNGQTGAVVLDADDIPDGTTSVTMTTAERTKLSGVATGATANSTDAQLRDRSTHTGTQAAGTITGLSTVATSGAYADLTGQPAIPDTPGDIGAQPAGSYATGAQGALADTAVQPADLDTYATDAELTSGLAGKQDSGDYATNTALTSGLAGKADAGHGHAIADVTGLQTDLDTRVASSDIDNIVVLTQAAYDGLGTYDARTLYNIVG